ncbi:hypothetical protein HPP92_013698 [Vanilla planifolia]|uniref:Arabinogalactan peptide 16 n=1 Tax=Vanilla planifolia TaxID=51239 RepID=A0A835UVG1_VANPL|nr:hypothetical protein HPP92_014165 [Vanilla planifolia]KAG0478979.1 hypothetical protein HPP92_013698 [Vanilla planifolia]
MKNCFRLWGLLFVGLFISGLLQLANGQSIALSPGAAPPMSNDGKSVDQGIAYMLMIAALLLTYLIH